jgi:hypothetical protein
MIKQFIVTTLLGIAGSLLATYGGRLLGFTVKIQQQVYRIRIGCCNHFISL